MPRLEDERLLRGHGRYTDDWHLPNQAYAAFVRSPHAHADILAIHTTAATAANGVLAILTAADYLADGCVGIRHMPVPADTVHFDRPAFGEFDGRLPFDEPHLPLASERVRYPGEAVAVVIAETQHAASDAASLVEVDYAVLPAVSDAREALAADAPAAVARRARQSGRRSHLRRSVRRRARARRKRRPSSSTSSASSASPTPSSSRAPPSARTTPWQTFT